METLKPISIQFQFIFLTLQLQFINRIAEMGFPRDSSLIVIFADFLKKTENEF